MKKKKIFSIILIILVFIVAGSTYYSLKIEPYRLTVKRVNLDTPNNTKSLKIVQFTDVHLKENFNYKNLDKVVKKINQQNPDVVIYSGDFYDHYGVYHDDVHAIAELKKIKAKYAKLVVFGNHDRSFPVQYQNLMASSGFTLLQNQNYFLTTKSGKRVEFTGLDDGLLGNSQIPTDSSTPSNIKYKILLSHEPEQILRYTNYHYDIAIVGHSHGGQINLPIIRYLILKNTNHSTKYVKGMYNLSNSNIQKMYVDSGIGTTQLNARFRDVPQITVFNLYL